MNPNRVQRGVRAGGQYSARFRSDASLVVLDLPPVPVADPVELTSQVLEQEADKVRRLEWAKVRPGFTADHEEALRRSRAQRQLLNTALENVTDDRGVVGYLKTVWQAATRDAAEAGAAPVSAWNVLGRRKQDDQVRAFTEVAAEAGALAGRISALRRLATTG